jgi:hypothetical protein
MPIDPERKWIPEPAVEFQFPASLIDDAQTDHRILNPSDYRLACERLLPVLCAIDDIMSHSRQHQRDWQQISLALGLPSSRYLELTELVISRRFGVSKMAVSKMVTKLLRLAELKPNGCGYNGRGIKI